jgi:hypothetical protein
MRTLAKGSDDERVGALQKMDASPYQASFPERRLTDTYELATTARFLPDSRREKDTLRLIGQRTLAAKLP